MIEKFLKVSFFRQIEKKFIIRVKKYFRLPKIESYFSELELKECKGTFRSIVDNI